MRRLSRRGGLASMLLPLLLLLFVLFFLSSPAAAEAKEAATPSPPSLPPPQSLVRLRSLEVGPRPEDSASASGRRIFPFPRLLLEEEEADAANNVVIAPPPQPDPKDERWGPLARGTQAIVSFGGGLKKSLSSSSSSSSSPPSPSAAAVAAIERVGGTVSDSLPDDALLAVGLTEEALQELEGDQGKIFFLIFLLTEEGAAVNEERKKTQQRQKKRLSLFLSFLSYSNLLALDLRAGDEGRPGMEGRL